MTSMAVGGQPQSSAAPQHRESLRETIDSIVIALILAFVFRAFVVEAFIIPTGSMAPTLYGAHATVLCESCGTEFAYGLKDPADVRQVDLQGVGRNAVATCPNCNHRMNNLATTDESRSPESGDRILVLKWPFDLGIPALGPHRWDVTVFKDPKDGETNFIKRLVGMPNEVLMIVDGDVYTVASDDLSPDTLKELHDIAREKSFAPSSTPLLSREKPRTGGDPRFERKSPYWKTVRLPKPLSQKALDEIYEKMTIQTKAPLAQEVLWFTVYDHDFPPRIQESNSPSWIAVRTPASGWKVADRNLTFESGGHPEDFVALRSKSINANCAYNILDPESHQLVSDQRVRFVLRPESSDGAVSAWLVKWGRMFRGTVDFTGNVSITEDRSDGKPGLHIEGRINPLAAQEAVEVAFENLDYRLSLHVAGREVLASSRDPKSREYYGPSLQSLRRRQSAATEAPRIYGSKGTFEITHLVVERDVHYYHAGRSSGVLPTTGWGGEGNPIFLREGEYFMMGDNTAQSLDSRLWTEIDDRFADRGETFQLGTVPEDQLIGRAFFVYWPYGRRVEWLPKWLPFSQVGIIPDVGRMRWIR